MLDAGSYSIADKPHFFERNRPIEHAALMRRASICRIAVEGGKARIAKLMRRAGSI